MDQQFLFPVEGDFLRDCGHPRPARVRTTIAPITTTSAVDGRIDCARRVRKEAYGRPTRCCRRGDVVPERLDADRRERHGDEDCDRAPEDVPGLALDCRETVLRSSCCLALAPDQLVQRLQRRSGSRREQRRLGSSRRLRGLEVVLRLPVGFRGPATPLAQGFEPGVQLDEAAELRRSRDPDEQGIIALEPVEQALHCEDLTVNSEHIEPGALIGPARTRHGHAARVAPRIEPFERREFRREHLDLDVAAKVGLESAAGQQRQGPLRAAATAALLLFQRCARCGDRAIERARPCRSDGLEPPPRFVALCPCECLEFLPTRLQPLDETGIRHESRQLRQQQPRLVAEQPDRDEHHDDDHEQCQATGRPADRRPARRGHEPDSRRRRASSSASRRGVPMSSQSPSKSSPLTRP